jgi:hypothetical protein
MLIQILAATALPMTCIFAMLFIFGREKTPAEPLVSRIDGRFLTVDIDIPMQARPRSFK